MLKLCFSFPAYFWEASSDSELKRKTHHGPTYKSLSFVEKQLLKNRLEMKNTISAFRKFRDSLCRFKLIKLSNESIPKIWHFILNNEFRIENFNHTVVRKRGLRIWGQMKPDVEFFLEIESPTEIICLSTSKPWNKIKISAFRNFRHSFCGFELIKLSLLLYDSIPKTWHLILNTELA